MVRTGGFNDPVAVSVANHDSGSIFGAGALWRVVPADKVPSGGTASAEAAPRVVPALRPPSRPRCLGTSGNTSAPRREVRMFEILYGGACSAMQSFARRGMTQDEMLKVIAYLRSLKKP